MVQLSVVITTADPEFRTHITKLMQSSGLSIGLVDEKHTGSGAAPDLAVVDVRTGTSAGLDEVERLRASWPSASIFAVASTADSDQILQAMRSGANEFLACGDRNGEAMALNDAFATALKRTAERVRSAKDGARSSVTLSFFGAKGGAGTTTLAVNSAIEIARITKRPTLILDLHQFLGEVALFLGVRPRFTLTDAMDNLHRLDQEFLRELVVSHASGLDILAGGGHIDRPGPQDAPAVEQLMQMLGRTYDFIVVDVGTMTTPCADVAVFAANVIYLVANPEVASIRNARRLIDRFGQLGAGKDRLKILLNRTSEQDKIGPKHIETTLGLDIHGVFPSDESIVSAVLSSHSALAGELSRFAREIVSWSKCRQEVLPLQPVVTPERGVEVDTSREQSPFSAWVLSS